MFQINDMVMHGTSGICQIADIRAENFRGPEELYYILQPLREKTTIYCPVEGTKIKLRKLLTTEEINELIAIMPDAENIWIEHDPTRKERFTAILKGGDYKELICLLKTLYAKREEKQREGKKFHIADERIMQDAERMLHGEFAYVLGIAEEDVLPFILGKVAPEGK